MKLRNILLCAVFALPSLAALSAEGDWPSYGNDAGMMKYSPLAQVTPANVSKLRVAWTYHYGLADITPATAANANSAAATPAASAGRGGAAAPAVAAPGRNWSMTPLVVNGVMYFATPNPAASIVALDPVTGKEIWKWSGAAVGGRGLAYWPGNGSDNPRVVFGVPDGMMAVDAVTGQTVASFGTNGKVLVDADLPSNLRTRLPNPLGLYKDVIISGAVTGEGGIPGPSGDVRGWDVRTGKLLWRFHTIPQPGEPGFETWPNAESVTNRPGANVWSMFSVDEKNGLVFAPIGSPGYDWYGGDRHGDNLYGNSVVALDALTGKKRWHYQIVRHDLNDFDVTSAPTLLDVQKDGKTIPALAQGTKMGMIFFLNRLTGEPIFGVEERPVPQSTAPGEKSAATQPFPRKPPPLARMTMKAEELGNLSPESRKFCSDALAKLGGGAVLYSPTLEGGTLNFPGTNGGTDWGGLSYNPQLGYIFANITNVGTSGFLVKNEEGSQLAYRNGGSFARFVDQDRYPCQIPPWGELAAINAHTGDVMWKVPLGSYAELEAKGFNDFGAPNLGGSVATASGLIFIGATNDKRFRAFDAKTGAKLWQVDMKASGNATPITYMGKDGKQYVVITSSGPGNWRNVGPTANDRDDSVIAYTLGD